MEDGYEQELAALAQEDLHNAVELYQQKVEETGDEARSFAYTAVEMFNELQENKEEVEQGYDRFAEGLATYMSEEAQVLDEATLEVIRTRGYIERQRGRLPDEVSEGHPEEADRAVERIWGNNEEWFGEEE
jgi:hypothetical protein